MPATPATPTPGDDGIPTDEEVRGAYINGIWNDGMGRWGNGVGIEFDRWLAAHDAAKHAEVVTALAESDIAPLHVVDWLSEFHGPVSRAALTLPAGKAEAPEKANIEAAISRISAQDAASLNAVAGAVFEVLGYTPFSHRYAVAVLALEGLAAAPEAEQVSRDELREAIAHTLGIRTPLDWPEAMAYAESIVSEPAVLALFALPVEAVKVNWLEALTFIDETLSANEGNSEAVVWRNDEVIAMLTDLRSRFALPVEVEQVKALDPAPWHEMFRSRHAWSERCGLKCIFDPREEYSQSRADYAETGGE